MRHSSLILKAPNEASKVLLHTCCAPCSSAIIECLLENEIRPTIFFFNPNIYPNKEYERRKAESIRHAQSLELDFVDVDYDHQAWLQKIKGLEHEPERGGRCQICFDIRMKATALYASQHDFNVFTTTLASSRWKNLEQIALAANNAAALFNDVTYWQQNWRKGGLSERRKVLIQEYTFYNQDYCGCEFSIRKIP